jgi:hypothetical protein
MTCQIISGPPIAGDAGVQFCPASTYIAHAVGAGKSYAIAAAIMKQKQLSLISKALLVVPVGSYPCGPVRRSTSSLQASLSMRAIAGQFRKDGEAAYPHVV